MTFLCPNCNGSYTNFKTGCDCHQATNAAKFSVEVLQIRQAARDIAEADIEDILVVLADFDPGQPYLLAGMMQEFANQVRGETLLQALGLSDASVSVQEVIPSA